MDSQPGLSLRAATPRDAHAIRTVAHLDSSRAPDEDALVGEVSGEIVAVIGMRDGHVVADPFRPTAGVVELLRTRRSQLVGEVAA